MPGWERALERAGREAEWQGVLGKARVTAAGQPDAHGIHVFHRTRTHNTLGRARAHAGNQSLSSGWSE